MLGLKLNHVSKSGHRWQAITLTNDVPVYWHIWASLGLDELRWNPWLAVEYPYSKKMHKNEKLMDGFVLNRKPRFSQIYRQFSMVAV